MPMPNLNWECPTVLDGLKFIADWGDFDDGSEASSDMAFAGTPQAPDFGSNSDTSGKVG